jgi:hypothetical protein
VALCVAKRASAEPLRPVRRVRASRRRPRAPNALRHVDPICRRGGIAKSVHSRIGRWDEGMPLLFAVERLPAPGGMQPTWHRSGSSRWRGFANDAYCRQASRWYTRAGLWKP